VFQRIGGIVSDSRQLRVRTLRSKWEKEEGDRGCFGSRRDGERYKNLTQRGHGTTSPKTEKRDVRRYSRSVPPKLDRNRTDVELWKGRKGQSREFCLGGVFSVREGADLPR